MSKYQTLIVGGFTMLVYFFGGGFLLGIESNTGLENQISSYSVLEPIKGTFYLASSLAESWTKISLGAILENTPIGYLVYSACLFLIYMAYTNRIFRQWGNKKLDKISNLPLKEKLDSKFGIAFGVVASLVSPLAVALALYLLVTTSVLIPIIPFFSSGYSAAGHYVEMKTVDTDHRCAEDTGYSGCNTVYLGDFSFKGGVIYKTSGSAIYRYNKRFYYLSKDGEECVVGAFIPNETAETQKTLCEKLVVYRQKLQKKDRLTH